MASYADIAAKGPKQTPEEAAAPRPPSVSVSDVETSTSSLVDVDTPSVHTVPADFREQEVKTETQAERLEHEAKEAEDRARAEADLAKKKAKRSAHKADNWLTSYFENLSDGAAATLAVSNFVAVLGLSGWLGYKAYGLYERRLFGWKHAGIGLGVLGVVGAFEGVFTTYLNKGKNKKA
jgi:uncharacterized membrane protein YdbT with pleckstrin-like domain